MGKKLLIVTQKIDENDNYLGFFHRWVLEFSKNYREVTVICLYKGVVNLPENVSVYSLGKESGKGKIYQLVKFYYLAAKNIFKYDTVFVHMNQIYVVLFGLFWKLFGKKVYLWYTHKQVSLSLKIATIFSKKIFTASSDGFRVSSKKVVPVGHGIDVNQFNCPDKDFPKDLNIIHVGRVTPIKKCLTMVRAIKILKDNGFNHQLNFIGGPVDEKDKEYQDKLKKYISKYSLENNIIFHGSVPHNKLQMFLCSADITINGAPTGGMDKSVLESLCAKIPVFFSNHTFFDLFGEYKDTFYFPVGNHKELATQIANYKHDPSVIIDLSQKVKNNFSVETLVSKLTKEM